VLTFAIYTQALIVTILYCLAALPFFCLFLLLNCASRIRRQNTIRFFILWYGKAVIRLGWFPYVKVIFENPAGTPAGEGIYIFNHRSSSDPFLVAAVTNRPPVQVVNHWPMRLPFFGVFARNAGYLDITKTDYGQALAWTRERLAEHAPIMVFPEGTRSGNRTMNQFHGTFFRIAKELDCPLIPVAVSGNENCPDRRFRMSCGTIRIRKLAPVDRETVRNSPPFQLKNRVRALLLEETRNMDEMRDL